MTQTPEKTETTTLVLCQCCAMKLANDDDSSCRDFHQHTHADLSVPAGAALVDLEPTCNEGTRHLVCDGHGEKIAPLAHYWIAEVAAQAYRRHQTAKAAARANALAHRDPTKGDWDATEVLALTTNTPTTNESR